MSRRAVVWSLIGVALLQWLAMALIMTVAWALQRRTQNSGWIDMVWTFGLGAVGVTSALIPGGDDSAGTNNRQILVAILVALWALRLGGHIYARSAAKSDDPRYRELIDSWGDRAALKLFDLLQKQALVSLPLAFSIYISAHNPAPGLGITDFAAVLICVIAIAGEAISDRQLRQHIKESGPQGTICTTGLWRYSRHPNYFFEWLYWLALPIVALDLTGGYSQGVLALLAPVTMYWLLRYVSGIPPLEEHMVRKHGDRYRSYQKSTNAFFPGVPSS